MVPNVSTITPDSTSMMEYSPLDDPPKYLQSKSPASMDNNMVSAVCKEIMKMMQTKTPSSLMDYHSVVNFAGTVSAFHVTLDHHKHASESDWIIDTGASDDMAFAIDIFASHYKLNHPIKIALPDGSMKLVDIVGSVILTPHITLTHVLLVPDSIIIYSL